MDNYWRDLRLQTGAMFWWLLALLALVSGEALGPVMVAVFAAMFLIGEPVGVYRLRVKGIPGGTFTELIRKFFNDKPYRRYAVQGLVWYVCTAVVTAVLGVTEVPGLYSHPVMAAVRVLLLFVGVGAWLKPHLLGTGERGTLILFALSQVAASVVLGGVAGHA